MATDDPEGHYLQFQALIAEMPVLSGGERITPAINRWLGKAAQLVNEDGSPDAQLDSATLRVAADGLVSILRNQNAQAIEAVVFRALARAEAAAPAAGRGGFIAAGAALDALRVVTQVLTQATRDILIVDPYMDAKVLTDFAPVAPAGAAVRLLSDSASTKPAQLQPAIVRWHQQYAGRPLEGRLTAPRALHDRLILIDGTTVWSLSQSLKDFANRSPALVQKVDATMAPMKVAHYEGVWAASAPVR